MQPGEVLTVTWPVPAFIQTHAALSIPGRDSKVTVHWVGSQVVAVEPRGQYLPMFEEG